MHANLSLNFCLCLLVPPPQNSAPQVRTNLCCHFLPKPRLLVPPTTHTQVKKKMSVEDFLKNNRGINDGSDLPPDFMRALYDRIVHNEIKVRFSVCRGDVHRMCAVWVWSAVQCVRDRHAWVKALLAFCLVLSAAVSLEPHLNQQSLLLL